MVVGRAGRGLYSTTGFRSAAAGLLGMGPDGAIAYKPNYQSNGPTRVRERNGADWMLTPNHAYALQLLGGGRAIWIDSVNGLSVAGIPMPLTYPSPLFPYAFVINGVWWIGYQAPAQGTLAHPFDNPNLDHVLVAAGVDAWPAFRALSPNSFRFAWSSTEAEQAGQVTISTVTLAASPMVWCDVASNGAFEKQYTAPAGALYPRVDIGPTGVWVAGETYADDTYAIKSSAGVNLNVGPCFGVNPGCVRLQTDGLFHVYVIAFVSGSRIGRHFRLAADGTAPVELATFSAVASGSQGIQDVTVDGIVQFWDQYHSRIVDGLTFFNTRERGDYIVGVLPYDPNNRVSVYVKSTDKWYRPSELNVQVLAGVDALGTVSIQAGGGGFFPKAGWLTHPFNPHVEAGGPGSGGGEIPPPVSDLTGPRAKIAERQHLSRQYPHVEAITDWRAQQTTRLLWDRVFDLEERLQSNEKTAGDLVEISNDQDDHLVQLRRTTGEALALAQAGAAEATLPNTMPNYSAIVHNVLNLKFVQPPIVPAGQSNQGQAQLCRAAAWEMYQADNRIRLLKKTGGTQVNDRSIDIVLISTDGSAADCNTAVEQPDGTFLIKALWIPVGPDKNSMDTTRFIVPTAAIAAEPGPLTPIAGGGSGSGLLPSDPIVAMSSVPGQISADVTSSFNHFSPIAITNGTPIGDVSYWIGKAGSAEQFSDGKWYLGHNKYWEDRMDCFNPGFPSSADPAGGSVPAVF